MQVEKIKELGFVQIDVSAEESGDVPFSYFCWEDEDSGICFITDSWDGGAETPKELDVQLFDYEPIMSYDTVKSMIADLTKDD